MEFSGIVDFGNIVVAIMIVLVIIIAFRFAMAQILPSVEWDALGKPVYAYIETLYLLGHPDFLDSRSGGTAIWIKPNKYKVTITDSNSKKSPNSCLELGFPLDLFKPEQISKNVGITQRAVYDKLAQLMKLGKFGAVYDTACGQIWIKDSDFASALATGCEAQMIANGRSPKNVITHPRDGDTWAQHAGKMQKNINLIINS